MNWGQRTLLPRGWNCTAAELEAEFPCDRFQPGPYAAYGRAVDVDADAAHVFRWLCQLRVAPYSYDWIDNGGRRSSPQLTPGVEQLTIGQRFLVFELVAVEPGRQFTGVAVPAAARLYGDLTITYQVEPVGPGRSRLVVRLDAAASGPLTWLRRELLAAGDTVMMRKQLLTIKKLAERPAQG